MIRGEGACLVCAKPLIYFEEAQEMECAFCHKSFLSRASCQDGHFICDACHSRKGLEAIMAHCVKSHSRDPIAIMQEIMEDPFIHMHGPEHHVLVGAALLTAYRNSGGSLELPQALEEMRRRGGEYPGGACGFWGCCGAAVSAGMFASIVTGATPLSGKSWGLANRMTGKALEEIAALGGPRCCKRNSFTAAKAAAGLVKECLGVSMELPQRIRCTYSAENQQCLRGRCPYYQAVP